MRWRAAGAPMLLRAQQVKPALKQPAHVGEVGLLLLGVITLLAELVIGQGRHIVEELRRQDAVDPSAPTGLILGHRWLLALSPAAVPADRSLIPSRLRASVVDIGGRCISVVRRAARSTSSTLPVTARLSQFLSL